MALTPQEEAELAELEKQVSPELRAAAAPKKGAAIDQKPTPGPEEGLGGIKAVYGKDWTPYGQGGQPIAQTQVDTARDDAALDADAERVAGMLDPRFSLVPQILALQPATNDPQGDDAAAAKYQAGQKDAIFIYEPPVDVVRRHLLENPGMLRAVSPDEVPSTQDIEGLTADSPLYKTAADWMYKKASEAATEKGQKIIRYRDAPWLHSDKSIPQTLKLKLEGFGSEAANQGQAFVLGVDDMQTAGAGRATLEAAAPTTMLTQPRLGLNESVPQSNADVNAWTEQEYPLSYGAGQVVGMLNPRSVFNKLWGALEEGGEMLVNAVTKTRYGARAAQYAAKAVHPVLKSAAGALGDAAVGGVAAGAGQVAQEGVDAAGRGELPDLREAGERVLDVGEGGGYLSLLGSGGRRVAGAGAEGIRGSARFSGTKGPGAVGRTEPNMEYRVGREPRLTGETRSLVKESNTGGYLPSDALAEEIAAGVGPAAKQNTQAARGRARAERVNAQRTPEGATLLPMSHLQEASLERLRDHHQPLPGGGLHPVDDKHRAAAKVFNGLVEDVSTSPIEGAIKLDPDEAGSFLGARYRYKLLKDDIEAANARAGSAPRERIERDEYLKVLDPKKRAAADEEIEASIEDVVGDVTPTPARRDAVEQQVLRELVDEASFVEAHGSLGDYLKQRGIDAVYVKPRAYDARRADTLTKGLGDEELSGAAKTDRRRRSLGGQKGGYDQLIQKGEERVAKAEAVEKSVAPDGNAFKPIAGLYRSRGGEKPLVDQVKALADQSGVREQLDRLRSLQETLAIQNRASFRDASGGTHLRPTNFMDAAQLRGAFPVLKSLAGPLGPLRGSTAGRAALMGGGETEAAQRRAESGARGRYEAARDRRLKEIADAKAADSDEKSRKQSETIRRRR